jgi:hypothetical protein
MDSQTVRAIVEILAVLTMGGAAVLVLYERVHSGRGLGARSIQFMSVAMLIPAILIMALERILEPNTVGTLIGALTGYLLSGIGNFRNGSSAND